MYLYAAAVMWICSKFCSCLTVPLVTSLSSKTILKFIYDVSSWIWSLSCDWVTCALNPMYLWSETNHVPKARSSHITLYLYLCCETKTFSVVGDRTCWGECSKAFCKKSRPIIAPRPPASFKALLMVAYNDQKLAVHVGQYELSILSRCVGMWVPHKEK